MGIYNQYIGSALKTYFDRKARKERIKKNQELALNVTAYIAAKYELERTRVLRDMENRMASLGPGNLNELIETSLKVQSLREMINNELHDRVIFIMKRKGMEL